MFSGLKNSAFAAVLVALPQQETQPTDVPQNNWEFAATVSCAYSEREKYEGFFSAALNDKRKLNNEIQTFQTAVAIVEEKGKTFSFLFISTNFVSNAQQSKAGFEQVLSNRTGSKVDTAEIRKTPAGMPVFTMATRGISLDKITVESFKNVSKDLSNMANRLCLPKLEPTDDDIHLAERLLGPINKDLLRVLSP